MNRFQSDDEIAKSFGFDNSINEVNEPKRRGIFEQFKDALQNPKRSKTVASIFERINILKNQKINILIIGASGAGKSETINALLKDAGIHNQKALANSGSDSVTTEINSYKIGNCTVFDTPGLGDLPEKDEQHIKKIISKIHEQDVQGNRLINLVIVILSANNLRNLKSEYTLINDVLIPNMADAEKLIIAINKIDLFDDCHFWNLKNNQPTSQLKNTIEIELQKIRIKIKEATNIETTPIYYSAGRRERNKKPWNLIKLYDEMNKKISSQKKISLASTISTEQGIFDNGEDVVSTKTSIKEDISNTIKNDIQAIIDDDDPMFNNNNDNQHPDNEPRGWLGKIIAGITTLTLTFLGI